MRRMSVQEENELLSKAAFISNIVGIGAVIAGITLLGCVLIEFTVFLGLMRIGGSNDDNKR